MADEDSRATLRIAIAGAVQAEVAALALALGARLRQETGLRVACVTAHALPTSAQDIVVCDATALMLAACGGPGPDARGLAAQALALHRTMDHTLLTALDLAPTALGMPREAAAPQAAVEAAIDDTLRALLIGHALPWSVVPASGEHAVERALDALAPLLRGLATPRTGLFTRLEQRNAESTARSWRCESCDDPDCERVMQGLMQGLVQGLLHRRA